MENMTKDYQQYINEIEECKNKISEGMTSNCKKLIDECYSECVKKRVTELELYDRKAVLFNDKNYIANSYYDFLMSIAGGFIGAIIGYSIDDMQISLTENIDLIKNGEFFKQNPMQIIYGNFDLYWVVAVICISLFVIIIKVHKRNTNPINKENVFKIDMCEYELNKIDELLNKL